MYLTFLLSTRRGIQKGGKCIIQLQVDQSPTLYSGLWHHYDGARDLTSIGYSVCRSLKDQCHGGCLLHHIHCKRVFGGSRLDGSWEWTESSAAWGVYVGVKVAEEQSQPAGAVHSVSGNRPTLHFALGLWRRTVVASGECLNSCGAGTLPMNQRRGIGGRRPFEQTKSLR